MKHSLTQRCAIAQAPFSILNGSNGNETAADFAANGYPETFSILNGSNGNETFPNQNCPAPAPPFSILNGSNGNETNDNGKI